MIVIGQKYKVNKNAIRKHREKYPLYGVAYDKINYDILEEDFVTVIERLQLADMTFYHVSESIWIYMEEFLIELRDYKLNRLLEC
jgi:hypothetical protein